MTRRLLIGEDPRGHLAVWERPIPGASYVIGGDIALARTPGGKTAPDGDQCTACVLRRMPRRRGLVQAAEFAAIVPPFIFGEFLAALGFRYNLALLNPERNLIESVRAGLLSAGYPESRFFVESRTLSISGRSEPVYFTQTTASNKKFMVDTTTDYLARGKLTLRSKPLLEEVGSITKTEKNIPELNGRDRSVALFMGVLADSLSPEVEETVPETTRASQQPPYGEDPVLWKKQRGIPLGPRAEHQAAAESLPEWDEDIASRL